MIAGDLVGFFAAALRLFDFLALFLSSSAALGSSY